MIPLYLLEKSASTNSEMVGFLKITPQNTAICTFNQTNGKGQYGNRWESKAGQNLAYSLAVDVSSISALPSLFNYHTACLVRRFIAKMTAAEVEVKWPNDIIVHQKKVAGILIEKVKIAEKVYYIIGVGINLLQEDFSGLPKAGSIYTQTGERFEKEIFATEFHNFISEKIFDQLSEESALEEYNRFLFRKNKVSVFERNGFRQNGIITKADNEGFLWIELEYEGLKKFYHKEIQMLY